MANKTMDRKKAVLARSQAAKAKPKPGSPKVGGAGKGEATLSPKSDKAVRADSTETLEVEDTETAASPLDEEMEADEAEGEVVETEEDEEAEEEKPARRRFGKKEGSRERDLVAVAPQDYSVSRGGKSRLPNNAAVRFVRSSYRELRLVTWPSRRDTWNWSLVVIGVCVAISLLLGAADLGLSRFVEWWISLAH